MDRRAKAAPAAAVARTTASPREREVVAPDVLRGLAAAAVAALGAVVAMVFFVAHDTPQADAEAPRARAGLGAAARAIPVVVPDLPPPDRCLCARADSPLWRDGIARLAILTFHGEDEAAGPLVPAADRQGRPRYDFDLAVVNDGADRLRDVRVTLTFARRNAKGRRVGAVDRGLFWSGVLAPGASVKWRVAAPGTEVRTDASVVGTLDEAGIEPASADAFWKLTASRFRAVRLHAAMMLAYLRDPRADAALRTAESGGDAELVAAIRRAAAPVIACEVERTSDGARACLFNGSSRIRRGLAIRDVRAGEPRAATPIEEELPVHEGRRVTVGLAEDAGNELEVLDPDRG